MQNSMMNLLEVSERILSGAVLVIAGDEKLLAKLPKGNWIGGTSVYFMTENGGCMDRENLFVTEIATALDARPVVYEGEDLPNMMMNRFDNGLSMVLIPFGSQAHEDFALHGATYPGLFEQPVMGWVTGVHLDDIGQVTPKVFDGKTGACLDEGAVVLHVDLPLGRRAEVGIVNLFEQDPDSDIITFTQAGLNAQKAQVNGMDVDFAAYLKAKNIDPKLPLVADYSGVRVNVAIQNICDENGVSFYAPVLPRHDYYFAKPIDDYAASFAQSAQEPGEEELSCNCVLNYLYCDLEGKKTGDFTGPATFGEIAYILLNQTMVRLEIKAEEQIAVA